MVTGFGEEENGSRKTREIFRRPRESRDREERIEKGGKVGVVMGVRVGSVEMVSGLKLRAGCFRLARPRS
jgi:hypothetical protein